MMYEIPQTTLQRIARRVTGGIKKWIGAPQAYQQLAYTADQQCYSYPSPLFSSVGEEYRVTKAGAVMMLRGSRNKKVGEAGVEVTTRRGWSAEEAVS